MDGRERALLDDLLELARLRLLRREAESQRLRREAAAEALCIDALRIEAQRLTERYDGYRRGDAQPVLLSRGLLEGMDVLAERIASARAAGRTVQARLDELRRQTSMLSQDIARQEERANCYRRMRDEAVLEDDAELGDD